jgi:hypothetical protein
MHCEPSFVKKAEDYRYRSAKNYTSKKRLLEVLYILIRCVYKLQVVSGTITPAIIML